MRALRSMAIFAGLLLIAPQLGRNRRESVERLPPKSSWRAHCRNRCGVSPDPWFDLGGIRGKGVG